MKLYFVYFCTEKKIAINLKFRLKYESKKGFLSQRLKAG